MRGEYGIGRELLCVSSGLENTERTTDTLEAVLEKRRERLEEGN